MSVQPDFTNMPVFSGPLQEDTPVCLVNRDDQQHVFEYIRTLYVAPAGKMIYITWKVACAWLADPTLVDSPGAPERSMRIRIVQNWCGYFGDSWEEWLEFKPNLEVYTMRQERIFMASEDMHGKFSPQISHGMTDNDMSARIRQLEENLALLKENQAGVSAVSSDIVLPKPEDRHMNPHENVARVETHDIPEDLSHFGDAPSMIAAIDMGKSPANPDEAVTPSDNQGPAMSDTVPGLEADKAKK